MKKFWMVGLLLGGCFEGGADTGATNLAQNGIGEESDPERPPGMEPNEDGQIPWQEDEACYELREQLGICYADAGQGDCAAAADAQSLCYSEGYQDCLAFEDAAKNCFEAASPDGMGDGRGCEQELAALDACYSNLPVPDCSAEDQAVANCFAPCDQLAAAFEQICVPPPPPPPSPDDYCFHLREALALCDAQHGGQNPMDPTGLNGEYACAPIAEAFERLCVGAPEPCPDGR